MADDTSDVVDEDGFPLNGAAPLMAGSDRDAAEHICSIVASYQSFSIDRAGNLTVRFTVPRDHKTEALAISDYPGLLVQLDVRRYKRKYRTNDDHMDKPETTLPTTDWMNDPEFQRLMRDQGIDE